MFPLCAIFCVLSCVSPVASRTFYSAHSDVPELTPHSGPDDNVISFAHLDTPPDPQVSGAGPADELITDAGHLTVSARTSEGFDLSWELRPPAIYDSLAVECRGSLPTPVAEVLLSGDSTRARIRGLNASTEYRISLRGITGSKGSVLLEAVAVTGTPVPLFVASMMSHVGGTFPVVVATTASSGTETLVLLFWFLKSDFFLQKLVGGVLSENVCNGMMEDPKQRRLHPSTIFA